ncbi:MAG: SAM-dependent methyltransferase [Burkholderiales bacterium]
MRQLFAWLLLLIASASLAVPPGEVSSSAETVCMLRAIGAQHPDPKLRNADTLASRFCPLPAEFATYEAARAAINLNPQQSAGFFYVNARTLHIDAMLLRAAREGTTQVVVLGAGFDSRAYRFAASQPQLHFFEVDLPDTLAAKKQRVIAALGALPPQVRYAAIDFDHQTLQDVLPPAGYDARLRTLFILEGVSMYISAQGTASTLQFIARHAAPGSRLVFDYALRRAIEGPREGLFGMTETFDALRARGEPMVTGWTQAEAASFVGANGLVLTDDLGSDQLTQRYLIGTDGQPDGRMLEGNRILDARVQ